MASATGKAGRGWRSPQKIWAAFGGVAVLVGFAVDAGAALRAIEEAGRWCWEQPVVLVLIGLLGALVALIALRSQIGIRSRGSADVEAEGAGAQTGPMPGIGLGDEHRAADKKTYEELVGLLERNLIRFLSEHDFGTPWSRDLIFPLFEYSETRNEVEHRFLDPVLEERRRCLHAAAAKLTLLLAKYGVWSKYVEGHNEMVGSEGLAEEPPTGERWERWEQRRRELGDAAEAVVKAYDELVAEARLRVP